MESPSELVSQVAVDVVTDIIKKSVIGLKQAKEWLVTANREHDPFGIAAGQYLSRLEQLHGKFRVFGMDRPRMLRDIYVRVKILPERTGGAYKNPDVLVQEQDHWLSERRLRQAQTTLSGLELISDPAFDKVLVLGKPGSGKTTFLRYLALHAPGERQSSPQRIPVYVSLRDWADSGRKLFDFICDQFDVCGFPGAQAFVQRMLDRGKLLLLLDGLDEVTGGLQPRASQKIRTFADKYADNQFVMSCRIAAYPYVFEKFTEVELANFDAGQIRNFVDLWFSDAAKAASFWRKVNEPTNRPVLELASNPLLLTMLCLVFDDLLDFPSNRSQLYKEAIDVFLKKWDSSRGIERDLIYKQLPLKNKENVLSRIAWHNFERGRYFIPQQSLEDEILDYIRHLPGTKEESLAPDSEAILKAIEAQHGLLVEQAMRVYSFSHLTLQEYFAARYAVEHEAQGTLERLVAQHLFEPPWREVLLLVAEMLAEADRFLLSIRERIHQLAEEHGLVPFLSELGRCILPAAPFPVAACRAIAVAEIDSVPRHALEDQAHGIAVELASALAADIPIWGPELDGMIDVEACGDLRFRGNISRLSEYLIATKLLVDCLHTEAYVSKETRNRLLEGLLSEP